jgi:GntR family galactonate operon transcriptional repressor
MGVRTAHRAVVDALAGDITAGRYRPGDSLPVEQDLCTAFAVSRTTIREALKTLSAKGIVSVRPKTGTRILPRECWSLLDPDVFAWRMSGIVDDELINDLIDTRMVIEPEAAALASQRATGEDIAGLRAAFASMAQAAHGEGSYTDADLRFHTCVLQATHNQFLTQLVPVITNMLRFSFRLSVLSRATAVASLPLHEAVLQAVIGGDAQGARESTRILIGSAQRDIRNRIGAGHPALDALEA